MYVNIQNVQQLALDFVFHTWSNHMIAKFLNMVRY